MRNSILFVLAVASLEAGCGAKLPSLKPFKMEVQQGNVVTSKMLLQLRPGMTRSQVRYIMGTPLIVDSFRDNRWDYFYELRKQGALVEKRRVILDFDKDSLASVRGDVVPSADNPEIKTIAEAPQKKEVTEKDEAWTDKLKFWKDAPASDAPAAVPAAPTKPTAEDKTIAPATAQPAGASDEVVPYIPEGEYAAASGASSSDQAMAAKVVDAVEPPPAFKPAVKPESGVPSDGSAVSATQAIAAPVAAVTATVAAAASAKKNHDKSAATKPKASAIAANKAAAKPVVRAPVSPSADKPAAVVMADDDEVIPYIPEGEYVAPVVPTEQEMIKGNMAEANAPAVDAQAHQVTEKGVAPRADVASEAPPTFVAEQLPEPAPEPELPPPPPSVVKPISKPAPRAAAVDDAVAKPAMVAPTAVATSNAEAAPGEAEIQQAVAGWAQAWRSKDVKNYLAAYAPDFVPEASLSRKAWEAQRKQRLSAAQGAITLELNNILVQRDGAAATVQFEQKYVAKAFKDSLNKTLDLRYEPAQKRWLITREYVEAVAPAAVVKAAEPAAMTASSAPVEVAVDEAIQAWAQAWRSKNTGAYFAAYAQTFVPDGLPNRAAWEAQRKKRLSPQQGKISLDIEDLAISRDGDRAVATFTQKYAAKSYSDQIVKRLELKQDAATQRWLIVRETAASGADIPAAKQQVTAPEGSAEHLDGVLEQIGF